MPFTLAGENPYTLLLNVTPQNNQVTCQSSCSNGHIDYLIFYYKTRSRIVKTVSTVTSSVVIPNLLNNSQYNFKAKAYLSGYDNEHLITESDLIISVPSTVPSIPTILAGIVSTSDNIIAGQIQLSWTASIVSHYNIFEYKVYFSTDETIFTSVNVGNVVEYVLSGLQNGADYIIKVSIINTIGESN